jgi:hypothetical protein
LKVTTVDINAVRKAGKLQIARANALEAYARLERALAILLGVLLGGAAMFPKANAIFFNMTSARNRNKAIKKLLELEHGNKYNIYWHGDGKPGGIRGLFKLINQLDQSRNEIIHWTVSRTIFTTDLDAPMEKLIPNEFFYRPGSRIILIGDMNDFTNKANFVSGSVLAFAFNTSKEFPIPDNARAPWLPIFQLPVSYPPPSNHPLSPSGKAPGTQPPTS